MVLPVPMVNPKLFRGLKLSPMGKGWYSRPLLLSIGNRVHHGYGEHCGILVTVVTGTVTVFNFSIPRTPCTLTRGVRVYHGVGAAWVQLGRAGECAGHGRGW